MPKIYNLSIILFVLGLYTLVGGCSDINIFKDKIEKNTTTGILVDSENNLSDSNLSGEIVSGGVSKQFKYCTLDLDECIRNNQRTTTGNPGFAPITLSGFIFSGNTITQPRYEDAPVGNNVSTIFFIKNSNTPEDITFNGQYTIDGKIMKGAESVEVIRDGDKTSYFLKKFIPKKINFSYNIAPKYGNIKPGLNTYLVRGYQSPNIFFERVFSLYYITEGDDIILHKITTLPTQTSTNYNFRCDIGYGNYMQSIENSNLYFLGISWYTFANQRVPLPGGGELIYKGVKTPGSEYLNGGKINIKNSLGKITNSVNYFLGCEEMGGASYTVHPGGYISIYQSYFEGTNDTIVYIPQNNKLISLNKDLLKPSLKDSFYPVYSHTIQGDLITITEQPYCCDDIINPGGYEEFVFNLKTLQLTSRKSLPTPSR